MVEQTPVRISRKLGKTEYERHCRIYFIEAPTEGLIKIGYTIRVPERFSNMLTMSPVPLSLLADMPGGPEAEVEIHARFDAQRAHGEWFRRTPELMAVIAVAETQYGKEWHGKLAVRRGAALQAYLAKLKAGEVVRPTKGKQKRPRSINPRAEPYVASIPRTTP